MRKDILIVLLSLFLLLFSSQAALGSQAQWEINWQEDGTLLETVTVKGLSIQNSDPVWQKNIAGDQISFTRTIKNWDEYNRLQDKLPLKIEEKNYIVGTLNKITPSNLVPEETLYKSLSGIDLMNLKISVPGTILNSSAEARDKQSLSWEINNPGQRLDQDFSLKVINIDGFMLGITILALGIVSLFIFFLGRIRRVNRLIDETYSLDNVVIEDDEIEIEVNNAENKD